MIAALRKKVRSAIRQNAASAPLLATPATARIFGYARVSTEEQNLSVQITALTAANCNNLFVEKISAVNAKRPAFDLMMKMAEPGDTILFHSLSRMGREVVKLHAIIGGLDEQGIAWRSLTEPHLTTKTSVGKFMVNMTAVMAQFERDQTVERTRRGMAELKRQGMSLGRTPIVSNKDARSMLAMRRKKIHVQIIAKKFGCEISTVYARTNKLKHKS